MFGFGVIRIKKKKKKMMIVTVLVPIEMVGSNRGEPFRCEECWLA
jgi:hypothetical protein